MTMMILMIDKDYQWVLIKSFCILFWLIMNEYCKQEYCCIIVNEYIYICIYIYIILICWFECKRVEYCRQELVICTRKKKLIAVFIKRDL